MKIYSEKTNQEYQTVDECLAAEKEFDEAVAAEEAKKKELAETRKSRAAEVEDAYKAVLEANKVYREKLNAFIKDYGSFHTTIKDSGEGWLDFMDIFGHNLFF
jgi:hypothetical protein